MTWPLAWGLVGAAAAASLGAKTPNPIFDAKKNYRQIATTEHGVLGIIDVPMNASLRVLHLTGTPQQRGFAQGKLLAKEVIDLVQTALPDFYKHNIDGLKDYIKFLPEFVQNAVLKLAESAGTAAFSLALDWLEREQRKYNDRKDTGAYDEIEAIAQGTCSELNCDAEEVRKSILRANLAPELIRMQCSMLGAWDSATKNGPVGGALVQHRALDFGGGPFANRQVLIVQQPISSNGTAQMPFASIGFPGFVSVVTGFNPYFSLSEKVNEQHVGGIPPGSYDGESVAFVLRRIVQFSKTHTHAFSLAENAHRTWAIWLGLGDASRFIVGRYTRADIAAYDDKSVPSLTSQKAFKDIAYIDKWSQPSDSTNMPEVIDELSAYGNITAYSIAQYMPKHTRSGDVHIAVYQYKNETNLIDRVLIATGITTADGEFDGEGARHAYDSPFLDFDAQWILNLSPVNKTQNYAARVS